MRRPAAQADWQGKRVPQKLDSKESRERWYWQGYGGLFLQKHQSLFPFMSSCAHSLWLCPSLGCVVFQEICLQHLNNAVTKGRAIT